MFNVAGGFRRAEFFPSFWQRPCCFIFLTPVLLNYVGQVNAARITLSVLEQLDGERKGKVIAYLAESQLITADNNEPSPQPEIELDGANLKGMVLNDVDQVVKNGNKLRVIIKKSDMTDSRFERIGLFANSDLTGSNFSNSILTSVDFTNANMPQAKFIKGKINNVNFTDTILKETIFDGVKLENIVVSPATDFDNACFTTSTTFHHPQQDTNLLTKDWLKESKEKRNIYVDLEAKTFQDCQRQIKTQ